MCKYNTYVYMYMNADPGATLDGQKGWQKGVIYSKVGLIDR